MLVQAARDGFQSVGAAYRAMLIARTLSELEQARASLGGMVALVPTMGALHAGHLSLVAAGQARAATVVVSIFVNPMQFGQGEDLDRYPRDEAGDLAQLAEAGAHLVWLPTPDCMMPAGDATRITLRGPAIGWEAEARPGHFDGVATVVARLFGQTRPDCAIFGEKDWQQLQVVRRMTRDLFLPVEIVGAPIARAADGLALSSRNRFLSDADRQTAPALYRALRSMAAALQAGVKTSEATETALTRLREAGFVPDYVAAIRADDLARTDMRADRIIAAANLGTVRLLDNIAVL